MNRGRRDKYVENFAPTASQLTGTSCYEKKASRVKEGFCDSSTSDHRSCERPYGPAIMDCMKKTQKTSCGRREGFEDHHRRCERKSTEGILDCVGSQSRDACYNSGRTQRQTAPAPKREGFWGAGQHTPAANRLYDSYPFGWHATSQAPDFPVCRSNPYVSSQMLKKKEKEVAKVLDGKEHYNGNTGPGKAELPYYSSPSTLPYPIPPVERIQCKDVYTGFEQKGDTFMDNFRKPYMVCPDRLEGFGVPLTPSPTKSGVAISAVLMAMLYVLA